MLVSIVMPTYNCGKYIAHSIDSVINQTFSNWELQIVDDCSTDNTKDVLQPYLNKYKNIHYYRLKRNSGVAIARTEAIKRCQGKYVAFLDADDLWEPNKLKIQTNFMKRNNIAFSCTAYKCMDKDENALNLEIIPPVKTNYKKCIRLSNPIGNLTAMYDREILGEFVVPNIRKRNDFALWLQVLKKTEYCYGIPQVLGTYRVGRKGSISSNKLKQVKYHWKLYHDIEKHSPFRSMFEIGCWAFVKGTGIGLNKRSL